MKLQLSIAFLAGMVCAFDVEAGPSFFILERVYAAPEQKGSDLIATVNYHSK